MSHVRSLTGADKMVETWRCPGVLVLRWVGSFSTSSMVASAFDADTGSRGVQRMPGLPILPARIGHGTLGAIKKSPSPVDFSINPYLIMTYSGFNNQKTRKKGAKTFTCSAILQRGSAILSESIRVTEGFWTPVQTEPNRG